MKICLMCDLHLPFEKGALQYSVLRWAIEDITKKQPDCIIFAGDVTCDGNALVYDEFLSKMNSLGIPFLYIPGNSDLRCVESALYVKNKASLCKNMIGDTQIFAINDCEGVISDSDYQALLSADENAIVFTHHPLPYSDKRIEEWCIKHPDATVFFGHLHKSFQKGNLVSLQAMDPDKAIGECPCITYYDTDTKALRKAYYFCPVPQDVFLYFGVSCYDTQRDIEFAMHNNLKCLELRYSVVLSDFEKTKTMVERWRRSGGENLSLHLPDIAYKDGEVVLHPDFDKLIKISDNLKVDRFTQHVPKISVKEALEDKNALGKICDYLAYKLNSMNCTPIVAVENMHMTKEDKPDDTRRYGYLPEECLEFMELLQSRCKCKVGINFDIGHARNNMPYSQKYQISTWLSMLGKHIVGYHIHQVTEDKGVFENHVAITEPYGRLISYASFFKCWQQGRINKAPLVFEMRPEGAYETTLKTFDEYKGREISDLHSHTFYSDCGRDSVEDLVETAIQNGVTLLGITDHNYGIGERKEQYLYDIRAFAKQYEPKITILCGIEIATLPQLFDIHDTGVIHDYDYCLIEHITDKDSIAGGNLIEFCKSLGIACGIAHTDLFAYCDMYGYDYAEFFAKLAEHNIFWEMNVSYDSIHKYREHEYVNDFMDDIGKQKLVKDAGLYISVGFDSHRCEDYDASKIHQVHEFLIKNKFNVVNKTFINRIK